MAAVLLLHNGNCYGSFAADLEEFLSPFSSPFGDSEWNFIVVLKEKISLRGVEEKGLYATCNKRLVLQE